MVEIEELPADSAEPAASAAPTLATKKKSQSKEETKEDQLPPPPPGYKYRKTKKDLPSVSHLLAHGSPESQGRPKTWCDIYGYPIFLAVCFAISLLIFHYAPHEKSVQPRGKFHKQYKMAQLQQQRQQEMMEAANGQPQQSDSSTTVTDNNIQVDVKPEATTGAAEGEL
ncbi:expressed unknown protein [Seminavis robusta]|uniref:Uncharacterized protein n=1 Tax=Seminavis robusta TaxID=568900 RepID=A0A9N8DP97_9STRA|nr:expressed unknown protein [Seminavis robusta]|eukprot:Sro273_g105150.1 n/a (169) ;mRNA; f:41057-41563